MLLYEDASLRGGCGLAGSLGVNLDEGLVRGLYSDSETADLGDAMCEGAADESE